MCPEPTPSPSEEGSFAANSARAKLIKIGREALSRYEWSSYPLYLKRRRQRPDWLVTERVMGEVGLRAGDGAGYEAYLEGRALEWGMKILGLSEQDLRKARKGMAEKQVLAWWIRGRTAVGRRWLSQQLWMGEESGVTRAVRVEKANGSAGVKRVRQSLLKGHGE